MTFERVKFKSLSLLTLVSNVPTHSGIEGIASHNLMHMG